MGTATLDPPADTETPHRPEGAGDDPEGGSSAEELAAIAQAAFDEAVGSQLTLLAGGDAPTASEFKLAGRSIELAGEFAKGSTHVLTVGVQVVGVEFVDKLDGETGQIVGTTRRHKLKIVAYDVVPETTP